MKVLVSPTLLNRCTSAALRSRGSTTTRCLASSSSSWHLRNNFGGATAASVSSSWPHRAQVAWFSSGGDNDSSHNDFAPQRKTVGDEEEAIKMIGEHVKENPIMLYMKGTPKMPMCGFSAKVVQTLQAQGVNFASVNVLDYPSIREGVKKFSEWPTIPQLYVKGEFVGGCDIVLAMHESGELAEMVQEFKEA